MPFDGDLKSEVCPLTSEFIHPGPFLGGRAGLRQLRDVLRGPLPANHRWNFNILYDDHECGTAGCALGVGLALWPERRGAFRHHLTEDDFGITEGDWFDIFCGGMDPDRSIVSPITPADVADRIDRVLARYSDVRCQMSDVGSP